MMKWLFVPLVLISGWLSACPYHGTLKTYKQPDGSLVDLKLFGTELYIRAEGLDGYTLVREKKSGWICYARLNQAETELISTGRKYFGKKDDLDTYRKWADLDLHIDLSREKKEKIIQAKAKAISQGDSLHLRQPVSTFGTPVFPVSGQIKGLCILVDFPDETSTLPATEYFSFCNDLNYSNFGNNGSLRTYYRDVSKGKVDYTNTVMGFYRAPHTFSYYDSLPYATGAQILLKMVLEKMDSAGFDFSTLSINTEDNTIMAINLMYTGEPANWAEGMWHHKGYLNNFTSSNGIKSGDYNCSPANEPLGIGVVAHENGHMIGKWPDTYKYNQNTGPDGIGAFDLMCWYGNSQNPVPPNPLFRLNAGWGKSIDIGNVNGQIRDTAELGNIRIFNNENDSAEFYLLEARKKTGRSAFIPDEGLTIWRINRDGNNQTTNHEVNLIPANNNTSNQDNACFRAGFRPSFHNTTTPSSKWKNGDPSGLRITTISSPGNEMTYNAGPGPGAGILKLLYLGLLTDDNNNGMIEPGENFSIGLKVKNVGSNPTGNMVATCQRILPNTNLVNISNPNLPLAPIGTGAEQSFSHQAQIVANADIGNEITLRFQITESGNVIFVTKKFMIGKFLNMTQGKDSLCNALFFDPGGSNSYPSNTFITQTIYPILPDSKVRVDFQSFDLENSQNCQYDFLRIHNGPTTNAPLMGIYCGTNSPGTVTSTHSSGALTFRFKADEGLEGDGWLAKIICTPFLSVGSLSGQETLEPFPNPARTEIMIPAQSFTYETGVFDMHGRLCFSQKAEPEKESRLDVRHLIPGIYLLRIKSEKGIWSKKIVKE